MRVAEQRSKRGRFPRRLFEGEQKAHLTAENLFRVRVPQRSLFVSSAGNPRAFAGRRTWGRLSLRTFFGEAKKVKCRRATPGTRPQTILGTDISHWIPAFAGTTKYRTPSIGRRHGPKNIQNPHQMAIYMFQSRTRQYHVDTNRLCVEIDIKMPKPTSIDNIAVPP
jgi:hypothetical protein